LLAYAKAYAAKVEKRLFSYLNDEEVEHGSDDRVFELLVHGRLCELRRVELVRVFDRGRVHLQKRVLLSASLRLSRACLGKMIMFSVNVAQKTRFPYRAVDREANAGEADHCGEEKFDRPPHHVGPIR